MAYKHNTVEYGFGQMGSVFNNSTNAIAPPIGKVFVALTMLTDVTFDTSAGLVADNDSTNGIEYIGTAFARDADGAADDAAHDESSSTAILGSGGCVVNVNAVFPKGITIYGRWPSINPASGTFIAYMGD